ncbi:MAG: TonB-dependent receptor, partial [Emcibacter sp.]|nr:TonB-dependent receptor [Emcibacter sp.]
MKNRCIFPSNSTSRMIAVWTVCGLMVGGSGSAYAQTDPYIDDLFDMDLEALTVSVASKRDEKVIEAPSVVSVITKDEIHRYGARNLLDILNRVPSLQYTNAAVFRNNAVSVRGQSNQIYSNRILFLINGRPFRDSFGGGLNMSLMLVFPVESISHLEVIRGPGSVLYGTNAFSSVINIITKEGKAEGEVYARATYGSEEYRSGEVGVSKGGKDWNVMLSGKILDQKGWENSLTSEFNVPGSYRQDDTGYGVMASGYYKGFNINSFLSKVDQKGLSVTFPVNQFEITRTFIDAGYRYDFYENWSASVNLTFNRLEFSTQYAKDFIAEMTLSGEIYKDLNFLVGGSYEDQGGKTAGLTTDYDRKTYSGYM